MKKCSNNNKTKHQSRSLITVPRHLVAFLVSGKDKTSHRTKNIFSFWPMTQMVALVFKQPDQFCLFTSTWDSTDWPPKICLWIFLKAENFNKLWYYWGKCTHIWVHNTYYEYYQRNQGFFFWFLVLLIKEFSNRLRRRLEDHFSRGEIKSNRTDNLSSC